MGQQSVTCKISYFQKNGQSLFLALKYITYFELIIQLCMYYTLYPSQNKQKHQINNGIIRLKDPGCDCAGLESSVQSFPQVRHYLHCMLSIYLYYLVASAEDNQRIKADFFF